jgi:SAM-dependent methyltransferase
VEPTDYNRRVWDEVHRQRVEAAEPPAGIPPHVRERLPDLQGKHVLHLHCGSGEETAELAALGALVTGIDPSPTAIAEAHDRAPTAAFVAADAHDLPLQLRRSRFDFVYASAVHEWLRDIGAFAAEVVGALRAGGMLIVHGEHPAFGALDPVSLRWRESYFEPETRPLGVLVSGLVEAGLVLRRLDELPGTTSSWQRIDPRVPAEFVLAAVKSAP